MTDSSPRARASDASGSRIFSSPGFGKNDPAAAAAVPARDPVAAIDQQRRGRGGDSPAHGAGASAGAGGGHTRASVSEGGNGAAATAASVARVPPPMPNTIVLPSTEVRLGLPHSNISPLLKAERGVFPFVPDGAEKDKEEEALQASAGAEAVVRDCLYNSHGMVALDGYLWKPGSIRLVRRWMMLVDNTLYYFVKPGDRKPRGVISLPGCIAEAVSSDEQEPAGEDLAARKEKEPRKSRVPNGYYGLRLFRPNHHGKDSNARLFLAKTAQDRDEWVAELRVASRVVPLEDIFQIKALLRKGAFASVHRCVRKDTQEEFAVKVIDKTSLSSHEKFLLRGEIGALKLVSHPNVVRLEAVHEDPRSIAIVMTLCRGGDLWDKVRSQPSRCFTSSQARTVMRPLCEAVLYLHTLGILHRDIKPENILLVDDGDGNLGGVILSDFGFSHQVSPKSRLACGKQLMGTPSYMAPESILHGMYGKEVDWFSCGCVLYMMLMGRAPFAGNSPSEIFRNTCHGRLGLGRGGASLWDKLPAAARELIVGLMQLDHNLRFTGEQAMEHRWLATPADEELGAAVGAAQQQQQQQQ
ncbi:asparagine-rich protein [Ectocarpus siliculosus]|uniref:Asparagine-rich protein n=1 Tax=Ectocarpus siliculosus TaxID=2880 RepID=D8LD50_ECTSI|nr:asparagine-rich protein [Ectocarpus siliculosus]|eukprot:CBN78417.1 asparagine-rich protein [Ectocarpus siliculosus]